MHLAGRLHVALTPAPPLALVVLDVHAVLQVSVMGKYAHGVGYGGSIYPLPSFPPPPFLLTSYLQVALVHHGVTARER